MAALTVNERDVSLVRNNSAEGAQSHPAAATFTRGTYVTLNAAGQLVAGGGANGGIAIKTAHNVGEAVSTLHDGLMDLGAALNVLAFGAPVYATPAGALDSAANSGGTTPTVYQQVGYVAVGYGLSGPTASKLLKVEVG